MNIKQLVVLLLILLLVPVFIGKVKAPQLSDFLRHPTWDGFKTSITQLVQDDYAYYKSLVTPWIDKLFSLFRQKVKDAI